jgi:hypothetical protein
MHLELCAVYADFDKPSLSAHASQNFVVLYVQPPLPNGFFVPCLGDRAFDVGDPKSEQTDNVLRDHAVKMSVSISRADSIAATPKRQANASDYKFVPLFPVARVLGHFWRERISSCCVHSFVPI